MLTVEKLLNVSIALNERLPTVAEFNANYRRLMFRKQGMPGRVLNVPMPLPSWAIDAGRD